MMAIVKTLPDVAPGETEALLPWHAAGTLNARDTRRIDEALAQDPELARQYAAIREEHAEIILLNESLGAPSARVMQKLFAAIDAEPSRDSYASFNISARIAGFLARLSPRTLATAAVVAVIALLLQAGVIGAMLAGNRAARLSGSARQGLDDRAYALVRFAPDARVSEIASFLAAYQTSIVDIDKGGLFRLKFGGRAMSNGDVAALMGRLQAEKVIGLSVATP